MPALRFLDVVLVVLTLPVILLLGAPVGGCLIGAGVWVAQRAIAELAVRKAQSIGDVRSAVKINVAALLGRAWLVTVGVVVAGVGIGDDHGAAAALTVLAAFTAYLALSLVSRAADGGTPTSSTPPGGSAHP
ncbi:hypothetical protein SK069_07475 [Patulibacter brassicae]|uniref:Uncharacterized protein n=1 Tax=Patulibacter brassicae TaxID=1705717 RepID=A0ABU4VKI5_9ACTN|nr:hypothetical protein [Patulibacter brassicae]MDX8151426.1 hypothetical protein [Patulibacter brassicae]